MNFLGCIKLGAGGAEAGSLMANNERIGSLLSGRYFSKAGSSISDSDIVEFVVERPDPVKFNKLCRCHHCQWPASAASQ
jgi:hypothetical protein